MCMRALCRCIWGIKWGLSCTLLNLLPLLVGGDAGVDGHRITAAAASENGSG